MFVQVYYWQRKVVSSFFSLKTARCDRTRAAQVFKTRQYVLLFILILLWGGGVFREKIISERENTLLWQKLPPNRFFVSDHDILPISILIFNCFCKIGKCSRASWADIRIRIFYRLCCY